MLKQLKYILNSFEDEELKNMDLWINGSEEVKEIITERLDYGDFTINLITDSAEVKINDVVDKEARKYLKGVNNEKV